jgi:tetratricopeptide (TPR) repeat protein
MGKFDEAIARKKRALEATPNDVFGIYALGQTCLRTRRYEEAEELFDKVINMRPDFFNAYYQKVLLYTCQRGDIDLARAVIESSIGKVDSARWRGMVRWLDAKEGKFEKVLTQYTMPPYDSANYYFLRGLTYWRMDRREIARAYYDSAQRPMSAQLADDPENADTHSRMGVIYAGLGQKENAVAAGHRAMDIAPFEKDPWYNFDYLEWMLVTYVMLDDRDKALEMLEHILTVPSYFGLALVLCDPDYAPLLDYPGFERLVEKYGNKYAKDLWQQHLQKRS